MPTLFMILAVIFLCGMGSCSPSLQQACRTRYPGFQEDINHAITVLVAWDVPLNTEGRQVASEAAPPAATWVIAPQDRDSWERWAEARLKEVQRFIDMAEEAHASRAKDHLNRMATELVTFHGQAQKGHLNRMISSLRKIETQAKSVRESCDSGSNPASTP